MKNLGTINQESFEIKSNTFKQLMMGAKSVRVANFLLIAFSTGFLYYSQENTLSAIALLLGVIFQIFYIFKYLRLGGIEQNPANDEEVNSSLKKFKVYFEKRKKNEIFFVSIWAISFLPLASMYLGSDFKALIGLIIYIAIVGLIGNLAFRKADQEMKILQIKMESKLPKLE